MKEVIKKKDQIDKSYYLVTLIEIPFQNQLKMREFYHSTLIWYINDNEFEQSEQEIKKNMSNIQPIFAKYE